MSVFAVISEGGRRVSDPMKIVVLGSNSFSGASFTNFALKQGAEVIGMSRSQEPNQTYLPYRWSGLDGNFRFFRL